MSGHSKWNNIKRKKEKTDAQKAKIFTKIGKEMAVAVKAGGPDPRNNARLAALIQKAKAMIPLLVPLFISAFRRANDLAMAMEARCYRGGEGRTKMKPLRYEQIDRKAYAILVLYLIIMIAAGRIF